MNRLNFLSALAALPAIQDWTPLASRLRAEHPRLLLTDAGLGDLRPRVEGDALGREVLQRLRKEGEALLREAPVVYRLVGPRLLTQSRRALDRIGKLALLWRWDGERRWLDRALKEMKAACAFRNWNPSHFLDTAEMTFAIGLGYDWLHRGLTEDDRALLREAIVSKGLDPALNFYVNRLGWTNAVHNWNQVCNGGILLGALAVAEDEPARAEQVVRGALDSLPRAMRSYAPDGGWNEGPGYWHYATRYTCYLLSGLETALGTDFGLAASPGFPRTGHFRLDFASPTGKTFNYADGGEAAPASEELYWLARKFSQPAYAWEQRRMLARSKTATAFDVVWWQNAAAGPAEGGWALDNYYSGVQTAFLRGSWSDPQSSWAAVKGGDNKANHAHLDLGSFVFDALGERWAMDLGADDYNLPQYFGAKRWTYYRLRTESHNTVLINGKNQDPRASAAYLGTEAAGGDVAYTFELANAYPGLLRAHRRTLGLVGGRTLLVRDDIDAAEPVEALWGMITPAEVDLSGSTAVLRLSGKRVKASVSGVEGARFEVVSTRPPAPQRSNEGTRKLVVRLPGRIERVAMEVRLEPVPA